MKDRNLNRSGNRERESMRKNNQEDGNTRSNYHQAQTSGRKKHPKKRRTKKMTKKKIPSEYYRSRTQNHYGKKKNQPKLSKYVKMKRIYLKQREERK